MKPVAIALLPILFVMTCRFLGSNDFHRSDQGKGGLYVLDIWENGHWILPLEEGTTPARKPPLTYWLSILFSIPTGGPTEFALRLASIVPAIAVAWLMFWIGSERWNVHVGIGAAWLFAAAQSTIKLSILVRPDMGLTLLTTLALFALHRLDRGQDKGMKFLFWLSAGLSILTKGPPGPVVIFGAVIVLSFVKSWRPAVKAAMKTPWIALLAIPALWFVGAILVGGDAYLKGTVMEETVDRIVGAETMKTKATYPGFLVLQFISQTNLWAWVALVAAALAFKGDRHHRVFAAAWLLGGLALFNVSRGQRLDYVLPLLPGAALGVMAALEDPSDVWIRRLWQTTLGAGVVAGVLLALSALSGFAAGIKALQKIADQGGVVWGIGLLLCAACLAAAWILRSRRGPSFFVAAAGMLVLMSAHYHTLSENAKSVEGEELKAFSERVNAERRDPDRLEFFGDVNHAVRFYTRRNVPSLTDVKVPLVGRMLLVCTESARRSLSTPHQELFRQSIGLKGESMVLLEIRKP